jgi:hypothetical protein
MDTGRGEREGGGQRGKEGLSPGRLNPEDDHWIRFCFVV